MSAAPKSILKKRPRAAVEPEAEESPVVPGQAISDERVHPVDGTAEDEEDDEDDDESDEEGVADEDEFSVGSDDSGDDDGDESDEDAIRDMLEEGQERPAKKLKHTTLRPTSASAFSSSLQHLISLPSTASNPVPKNAGPSAATLRLERKTRGVIRETKAAHLARGHVRDVIGGWGPRPPLPFSEWESKAARNFEQAKRGGKLVDEGETSAEREKRLRKLAQRGVVRLFNAIGAAQGVSGKDKDIEEQEKRKKLAVKVTAKDGGEGDSQGKTLSRRPNILGARGKNDALTSLSKASFLDLIRAGTGA
ncbi:hypothetical protein BMF94_0642 [Rhodotorula taiwanensis]|uniref:Rrp15p-domain-containing protein n=1 Tax=Rhodotorula taiwanensis TaxID=741276 RepID=A0A2S5BI47_9BASI|nr:hypothetical protein BMF94_0642 [Rhodotorula taiwanensis]